ncbi:hypothetical protein AX14_011573 [Amanita brunnescens Koide BX004]|nr:hypothetical protein AX14_011573 [Amanita brunnescens Koide BX004]
MPPRRGGPSPGPSPGPQDAFSPTLLFPTLLAAAVKIQPAFAELDEPVLRRTFLNMWAARPPPPADIQAATSILFAAARRLAWLAETEDDPFEAAAKASTPTSAHGSRSGSPALASLPDITFPHIDPLDVPAATSSRNMTPPSTKSLLAALLDKGQDDLRALDDEAMSLLKDLANRLFRFLRKTPAGTPSNAPKSLPAPTVPAAVQSAEPITKHPQSPPPRPPQSPTRPPPRALGPPPVRKPTQPAKQSYAKAAASAPAAPAAAPAPPKAPAPPSKSVTLRKSCIKQGTKATKVILRFPDSSRQPGSHPTG